MLLSELKVQQIRESLNSELMRRVAKVSQYDFSWAAGKKHALSFCASAMGGHLMQQYTAVQTSFLAVSQRPAETKQNQDSLLPVIMQLQFQILTAPSYLSSIETCQQQGQKVILPSLSVGKKKKKGPFISTGFLKSCPTVNVTQFPNSISGKQKSTFLTGVCLASALQRYYSIEQWSFYFWLSVDNVALNPWLEYCLSVNWAKPHTLAGSTGPPQPCLWPRLLRAAASVGEKQGVSQAAWRELGPTAWHPLTPGTPGMVFVNSAATCTRATWGHGRLSLQTTMGRAATAGSKSECSRYIFFQSSSECYRILKHGREKSICSSQPTASVSIQRCCMS